MEPEQAPVVAGNADGDAAEGDEQVAARRKKHRQEALVRALSTDYGNTTAERVAFHRNVVAHPDEFAYKGSVGTNNSNGELLVWACEACPDFAAKYPSVGKALAKARTVRQQLEEQLGKKAGRENTERAAELLAAPDEDEPAVAAAPLRGFDAIRIFTFSDEDGVGWLAAREVFSVLAARLNAPSEALLCSRLLRAWPMLPEAHHRLDCFALPHEYGQGLGRGGRSEARAHEVEPAVLRRQRAAAARDGVRAPRAAEIMEEEAVAEAMGNIQLQPMLSFVGLQLVLDPNDGGGWQGTEQAAINELLRHLAARFWASAGLVTVRAPVTVVGVRRTRLELLFDSWQLPDHSELYNYEMHLLGPLAHPHYGVFVRDVAAALMHCFPPARNNKWSDELVRTVLPRVVNDLLARVESPLVVRNIRGELLLWTWTGCFDELTTVPQRPLAPGESGWARAYNSASAEVEADRAAATLADDELLGENDPAVEAVRRRPAVGAPRAYPMLTPRGARFVLAELVTWARSKGTRIEPKVRDFARTYLEHYERAIRMMDDPYQNVAKADPVVIAEQFQG
jgi:hypothetical protein